MHSVSRGHGENDTKKMWALFGMSRRLATLNNCQYSERYPLLFKAKALSCVSQGKPPSNMYTRFSPMGDELAISYYRTSSAKGDGRRDVPHFLWAVCGSTPLAAGSGPVDTRGLRWGYPRISREASGWWWAAR